MYAPEVYQKASDMIASEREEGVFEQDEKPVYWVYELVMDGRSQTGVVACASIDDYQSGVIRKHENTRADKEADRIRHVDRCGMQTGPIFLAYRENDVIGSVTDRIKEGEAFFDFTGEDGVTHRGWRIDDETDIARIREAFGSIERVYIADGHHRAASAVRVGCMRREQAGSYTGEEEFNSFLCVLFPAAELHIMDYNRHVKDLNNLTAQEFLSRIKGVCDVKKTGEFSAPGETGCFSMYLDGSWYACSFLPEVRVADAVEGLDVSLLQNLVLSPMLGIGDPRTDSRIDFVGGIRGWQDLERRVNEKGGVAFAMYPTSMEELMQVADEERLMPPKSTWFEPKLRSGLFLHEIGHGREQTS